MKKIFLSAIAITFVLASCNQKSKEDSVNDTEINSVETEFKNNDTTVIVTDTVRTETQEAVSSLYACPMHPEEQGDLDQECPKCGMKLTEPVK